MTTETVSERIEKLFNELNWKADHLMAEDWEASAAESREGGFFSEENWKKAKLLAERELEEKKLLTLKKYYQSLLRVSLITKWISNNTNLTKDHQIRLLRLTMEAYLNNDRREELETYLANVLNFGVETADKKRKRELSWRGVGGWYGHILVVIKGIIYVVLVVALFSVSESRFQQITLAILVLTYNLVMTIRSNDAYTHIGLGAIEDMRFEQFRRVLKFPEEDWMREQRVETRIETDRVAARNVIRIFISWFFQGLVWLIALWELVSAIL